MLKTAPLTADEARTERIRQQASKSILSTQVRVNEHRLKKNQDDNKLAAIMVRLYEVKKAMELERLL